MKLLTVAGAQVMTGDAIARVVLEYSAALGNEDRVDVVSIPVITRDGITTRLALTVGAGVSLSALDHDGSEHDLADPATVSELRARIAALTPSGDRPLPAPPDEPVMEWPGEADEAQREE